jgi:hypothetical protein
MFRQLKPLPFQVADTEEVEVDLANDRGVSSSYSVRSSQFQSGKPASTRAAITDSFSLVPGMAPVGSKLESSTESGSKSHSPNLMASRTFLIGTTVSPLRARTEYPLPKQPKRQPADGPSAR